MSITAAQFAILGVAAFALTGLLTWPVRALAIRLGAMDAPNMARKTQAEPVPYLGGIAIGIGVSVVTFGALFFSDENTLIIERGLTAIIPALLLGAVGLIDDLAVGPIAQSVEQRTFNPWVDGSSPSGPTITRKSFSLLQIQVTATRVRMCQISQAFGILPSRQMFLWARFQMFSIVHSKSQKRLVKKFVARSICWDLSPMKLCSHQKKIAR
jgi:hypothetical protein